MENEREANSLEPLEPRLIILQEEKRPWGL
jgi:hypothetical protein